ncbi:hypothetical protein J6590_103669 [Homalodisca vitripennis]|nr:hypothetical protein J6590_103669 [Homalodisca vitripennis]
MDLVTTSKKGKEKPLSDAFTAQLHRPVTNLSLSEQLSDFHSSGFSRVAQLNVVDLQVLFKEICRTYYYWGIGDSNDVDGETRLPNRRDLHNTKQRDGIRYPEVIFFQCPLLISQMLGDDALFMAMVRVASLLE